jgi:SOS-response transcriptional repressor LexA
VKTKETVKQVIVDYIQEYDYAPSIREIADIAYCAQSTAHQYVRELLRSGELETSHPGMPRALRLPERRYRIDSRALKEVIVGLAGCDGEDDYARGWDDAFEAIMRAMDKMRI